MLYGDMKIKTISRSVLPAGRRKARSTRKAKQAWNQSTRHRMDRDLRQGFHPGMTAEATMEAWDANPSAWLDTYNPEERDSLDYIVSDRREADKLGPVRQWTRSHVADFEDRYELIEFVGRTLPDNLAGRHALGHMDSEFGPKSMSRYLGQGWRDHQRFEVAARYARGVAELETILVGSHAELNRRIRLTHVSSISCPRVFRTYEKPAPGTKSWLNPTEFCRGRVVLTPDNFYRPRVPCDKCGNLLGNNNLRLVTTPADIPGFIARLSTHSHAKLIAWIAEEAARQKRFMAQPERIGRREALVSRSGYVMAA